MRTATFLYWATTGLLCVLLLFSAGLYVFTHENMVARYVAFGYPPYLVYPSAVAKVLAVIAILSKRSRTLKEWAYAGVFFDLVLAFFAHVMVSDGQFGLALAGIVLWIASYSLDRRLFATGC